MRYNVYQKFLISILLTGLTYAASAQFQFIENRGQWDPRVQYKSDAGNGSFYLEKKGYTVVQYEQQSIANLQRQIHVIRDSGLTRREDVKVKGNAYKVEFAGASDPVITPEKPVATTTNYFIGSDPSKWVSGAKTYNVLTYQQIYPGIDIRYFMDEGQNLKYDFIVHPGAKLSDIKLKYSGVTKLEVDKKELVITTPYGKDRSQRPYSYQPGTAGRQMVDCEYQVNGDEVSFKVGKYDPKLTLVIDPVLIFFTYSGSTIDNYGYTATYGPDGSFYGGGIVWGPGFPVSPGAFDNSFSGNYDIGIIRLTPNGNDRIYATYIGGQGEDQPHSLVADNQGNLIIAGRTNSGNGYPVLPARNAAESGPGGGGYDIVVTKLSADGTNIIGSMRIGGSGSDGDNIGDSKVDNTNSSSLRRNYGDDARSEVILDDQGNIYVGSCTRSNDFPVTPGVVQSTPGGAQDAVLLKLTPDCQHILFSTYLGGSDDDAAYVVVPGKNNNVYVAGATKSANLPGIRPSGVIQPAIAGDIDGFVVELNTTGTAFLSGTYAGTSAVDEIYGIDVDDKGFPYIMGTSHGDMPVENAVYSNTGAKQFIWKMQPDLSSRIYATVYGSNNPTVPNISPTAFMVDRCENVYVSGWGGKANRGFSGGSVTGMPVTGDGQIKSSPDASGSDFHFFVMEKDAQSQLYGTFFGQNDPPNGVDPQTYGDHVDGGTSRFDPRGYIYQTMCVQNVPGHPLNGPAGTWSNGQTKVGLNGFSIMMLKIAMDFTGVRAELQVTMNGVVNDSVGCIPQNVVFNDLEKTNKGKLFYWDFGDGTGDTLTLDQNGQHQEHFYSTPGSYLVRLIAVDEDQCITHDTAYQRIYIGENRVFPDFSGTKLPPCDNLSYAFQNKSHAATGGTFNPNIFQWDFGDNSPFITNSFNDVPTHTYDAPGNYNVTLTIRDTAFCNSPADTTITIHISSTVQASFETPATGCAPYEAKFNNTSVGGSSFVWDFGDGTTSDQESPTHLYAAPGSYTIRLTANDPNACNVSDVSEFTITVSDKPDAQFTYTPIQPQENVYTEFNNSTTGAISYLWDFGDGDTSTEISPRHIFPETGTFTVSLMAANQFGCVDTVSHDLESLIRPLLDVPNAFTPGKFGINSTIGVAGFGIRDMQWIIYNRWGQKVFESADIGTRWDGTFKGKPLPMDVYSYTLKATFVNGTSATKTGDITLIR